MVFSMAFSVENFPEIHPLIQEFPPSPSRSGRAICAAGDLEHVEEDQPLGMMECWNCLVRCVLRRVAGWIAGIMKLIDLIY